LPRLGHDVLRPGRFHRRVTHFEAALRIHDPERDHDAKFRFGSDSAAVAAAYLAHAKWQFGEHTRARELIEKALARAIESAHAPTLVIVQHFKVHYDILRGDAAAARRGAKTLIELSREHGIALFLAMGAVSSSWARARLGDREAITELQQSVAAFADQGNKLWVPIYEGLLAELEAERGNVEVASSRIDQALGLAQQTGEHRYDAVLHRIRGEILLRNDPPNHARAEESLLNAIDIARRQKARSFELLGALALARVYRRTNRHAEARATLAPALEGFSPTPELPAVSDARTLLAELTS
jgi:predicted ATPase